MATKISVQQSKPYISFDTETTGLDPYRGAEIFAWSTCGYDGDIHVSRFDEHHDSRQELDLLLRDTSVAKVCHNLHFDLAMLATGGYPIPSDTEWHCTLLICQLLNNLEPSNSLDELAYKYGHYPMDQDKPIEVAARIYGSYNKIPRKMMREYQKADAERTMLLFQTFYPYIQRDPLLMAEYLNEIETVKATIHMEMRGIMVCKQEAEKLKNWLEDELNRITVETAELVPYAINLNSPTQVIKLLYTDLKWPVIEMNKSGLAPSTEKDVLETLRKMQIELQMPQHAVDILDLILRQRSYTKGLGMVQSYLDASDNDGILHPHINTNAARTGRESSENPNMQNISKDFALKTRYPVPARKCFRARPGYIIVLIDYAGIEMRLAVQATGSIRLIKLLESDFDFHDACAKSFYGERYLKADKKLKKMLRSAAKNGRFAMLYGAGIAQVAATLGLTLAEAKAGVERDKKDFPEFYTMMDDCIREASQTGHIVTFFGRKLKVNRKKAYTATDYKIQGSAAALFKRAQVRVDKYLREKWNDEIALWLPVHDELILEIPRKYLSQRDVILRDVKNIMVNFDEITVKLNVEFKQSTYTWADAQEFALAA
jgi:DNA polymerase-1